MKETPAAFAARTGIVYAPPAEVRLVGRALEADEPCPPLHRYVGPCGMAEWFAGTLRRLAPGGLLWMSAATWLADSVGARSFGTLLVHEPLRFHPVVSRAGVYVGASREIAAGERIAWLPPSRIDPRLPGDRGAVIESLARYLEELDLMRRSGAEGPGVPWLALPVEERRRRLDEAGVRGVWTGWAAVDTLAA
jgi:hypothetical protein